MWHQPDADYPLLNKTYVLFGACFWRNFDAFGIWCVWHLMRLAFDAFSINPMKDEQGYIGNISLKSQLLMKFQHWDGQKVSLSGFSTGLSGQKRFFCQERYFGGTTFIIFIFPRKQLGFFKVTFLPKMAGFRKTNYHSSRLYSNCYFLDLCGLGWWEQLLQD